MIILLWLATLPRNAAQFITQPSQWPGFTNYRTCVQSAFEGCCDSNILYYVQCSNYNCACNYTSAIPSLVSLVSSYCSGNPSDIPVATSLFATFCQQLLTTTITITPPPIQTAFISQPSQWTQFTDLRYCAQSALDACCDVDVAYYVGCDDYVCACAYSGALSTVSSLAEQYCSGDSSDIKIVTSIWTSFCSQLVITGTATPTQTLTAQPVVVQTAFISQPSMWPGFTNIRSCAQSALDACCDVDVVNYVGCQDFACACAFSGALSTVSSLAASYCGSSTSDISVVTSIWTNFCAQLLITSTLTGIPPATGTAPQNTPSSPSTKSPPSTITSPTLSGTLVAPALTNPSQWTGYTNLRTCAQSVFGCCGVNVLNAIGCENYICACDYADSPFTVSSLVVSYCSNNPSDVSVVTNLWPSFCSQLVSTEAIVQNGPTQIPANTTSSSSGGGGLSHDSLVALIGTVATVVGTLVAVVALWFSYDTWLRHHGRERPRWRFPRWARRQAEIHGADSGELNFINRSINAEVPNTETRQVTIE